MNAVADTIQERGNRYGDYATTAGIAQDLKDVVRNAAGYRLLTPYMRESLDMIFNKVSRAVNGDPFYPDTWHDIAGYAVLVEERLK